MAVAPSMACGADRPTAPALRLQTLSGCDLAIGGWPRFRYNASGGGGPARLTPAGAGLWRLTFTPVELVIPPLVTATTRFLGLPLPPGLRITVLPERLEGQLEPASGALGLRFEARFRFTVGGVYQAPDLGIATDLVSGESRGDRHRACGSPLNGAGEARLVGVASVAPTGEAWLDRFLGLPDEALAVLRLRLEPPPAAWFRESASGKADG
jgi:hypothetical protein